jgi:hypothetical protein
VRRECLGGAQLRFADHPLVPIGGVLDPVEKLASLDRQQPLDGVAAGRNMTFQPVGEQIDLLSKFEFVLCHRLLAITGAPWLALPECRGAIPNRSNFFR